MTPEIANNELLSELPDCDIVYDGDFLDRKTADTLFQYLTNSINWRQDKIKVFGKTYPQPRLTALYGNNGKSYSYSNITMNPHPFNKELEDLRVRLEAISGAKFTTCLLNLYRDGADSNGWHSDDEAELGKEPVIASISLGQPRYFHMKHRKLKDSRFKILLEHGSLLLMKGSTQHHWLHQLPKSKRVLGPRINLTFRYIK